MKTKIAYVLTSTPKDVYLEQAFVSMNSIKYYMPDAHITLVVDEKTSETFTSTRKKMSSFADEIVIVPLNKSYSTKLRSRLLKTNLRNYIKGDYLFIDTDTVICHPMYEVEKFKSEIAAVYDTHSIFEFNPYRDMCLEHGHKLNWSIETEKEYFNSGVIYVKDTPKTHDFFTLWQKNYLDSYSKGVSMDQPSFAKTNFEFDHIIRPLSGIWNCQFKHGVRFLKDAKIVHYFVTNVSKGGSPPFLLNKREVFDTIKQEGIINETINEIIKDPFCGIADVTHLYSGDDLIFFRTMSYRRIYKLYKNNRHIFNIIDFLFSIPFKLKKIICQLKK